MGLAGGHLKGGDMKRSSLAVAAVLILTVLDPRSAAAQVTFVPGVKGGLSISTLRASGESWSSLKRPALGAFLSINLDKTISIQPEIYWLTKGGAASAGHFYDEFGNLIEIEYRWGLSYIHLPVLAKLHPIPKGTFRPVLFAGPAFDILLRAVRGAYYNGQLADEMNITDAYKGISWDFVAGVGLEVALNKVVLVAEARCTLGLTNIVRLYPDYSQKTRALMFLAGFGF
jgi:hypothetical protein